MSNIALDLWDRRSLSHVGNPLLINFLLKQVASLLPGILPAGAAAEVIKRNKSWNIFRFLAIIPIDVERVPLCFESINRTLATPCASYMCFIFVADDM